MKYREVYMNLFDVSKEYALAHCVSRDFKMVAGIAKQFKKRFPEMKKYAICKDYRVGDIVFYVSKNKQLIFNLVTKKRFYQKSTYRTFENSIKNLKIFCDTFDIEKLAIPLLGEGFDKLNWEINKEIIKNTFKDTNIEILVCKKKVKSTRRNFK